MTSIVAARESHLPGILGIHNDAVLNTTAIWNEAPADLANRRMLLLDRQAKGLPFFVAEEQGEVLGYASYGDFRPWAGYRFTVEHSVYVHRDHRGRGLGGKLLRSLLDHAGTAGLHVMVAGIEAGNAASIHLHERLGFQRCGELREVGTKFGRWLDLVFMQILLGRDEPGPR